MQYAAFVFGIFGLFAYLEVSSLKKRIDDLEEQMRSTPGTQYAEAKESFVRVARQYIGRAVTLEMKEDELDQDVMMCWMKKGTCTLIDMDDDWMLVKTEYGKTVKTKLIRTRSVERIGV